MTWHWLGVELIFRIDKPSPIGRRVSGVTLKRIMLSGGLLALIGMGLFTPSVALGTDQSPAEIKESSAKKAVGSSNCSKNRSICCVTGDGR